MELEWKPLELGSAKSTVTFRSEYKGWILTHYTLAPQQFMAHKPGPSTAIRADSQSELIDKIDQFAENGKWLDALETS